MADRIARVGWQVTGLGLTRGALIWLVSCWCRAEPTDFFDLSLQELAEVKVTVASKQQERIADAPGSITSYSQRDIQELGYYNLADLANITPGYSSYTSIGENTLETRGQKASGFDNNRHLLLLDGIPINHIRAYSVQSDNHLPLYFAKQVDFLRGPASALYGVSAFYGVIDIDPLEQQTQGSHFSARASAGSQDGEKRLVSNYLFRNTVGSGGVRFGYYDKSASEDVVAGDAGHLNYDDQQSVFLYGSWQWDQGPLEGVRLGTLYLKKEGGLGDFWADYSSEDNEISWETLVTYVKYQTALTKALQFNSHLKYAYATEASTFYDATETVRSQYDYPFHSYEGQAELDWRLGSDSNLIAGVNYDTRYGESEWVEASGVSRLTPRTPDVDTLSLYTQFKTTLPLLEGTLITLGAREDKGEAGSDTYSKLSPRLAVVQRFTNHFNLKLMYGEALRGPSVKELGVNDEVRAENPAIDIADLQPEQVKTFEVAPVFQSNKWLLSLTYFETHTEEYLGRNWASLGEYVNSADDVDVRGWELEAQYHLNSNAKWFFNSSRAESKTSATHNLSDVPDAKANLGLMWGGVSGLPLSGSVVGRWVNEYSTPSGDGVGGFTVLDLNLNYMIAPSTSVGLQLRNLFDKEYYLPLAGTEHLPMPGASFLASIEYHPGRVD
ncbi:MAG: TonB-dependent receptor [Ketobacter sp.]|nr:TonB-dependent receptor [Ketobacter sp.]